MRPVEKVRAALEARGLDAKGPDHRIVAQCPAHEDRSPSLGVVEGDDGRALVKCYAGCTAEEVVKALDLEWGDLFVEEARPAKADDWTPEAEYVYTDAEGNKLFKVIRFPDKRFRQQRWTPGGWEWGLEGVERQLFRLPDVLAAKAAGQWVFVCEGEKDAIAVTNAGQCGTTMPGGAGKWEPQYTATLEGAKVVILADDDGPGHKHAGTVFQALYGKAAQVGIRLPAEGHKDAADHLAAGLSLNGDLRKMTTMLDLPADNARPSTFTAAVFASRRGSDKELELLGPLFQRGMRTVVGAQTGEGKTSFALQAIHAMLEQQPFLGEARWRCPRGGARALIVDLEQGEETVKARLLDSGLASSERVDVLWEPSGISIDSREEDRAMVRDVLKDGGYDLVLLDPLYQLHGGSGNDESVAANTMRIVDGWAREFNVSLVLPMHARKPHPEAGKNFTIHDIAGVGTWLRNAEFVLGLQLMYAGQSRLWFFKDRIGRGPTIRTNWWLDWTREGGFTRNYKEERDRLLKQLRQLLARDEGASLEELHEVEGVNGDEVLVREALKRTHQKDGRHRTRKWPGQTATNEAQTAMSVDTT